MGMAFQWLPKQKSTDAAACMLAKLCPWRNRKLALKSSPLPANTRWQKKVQDQHNRRNNQIHFEENIKPPGRRWQAKPAEAQPDIKALQQQFQAEYDNHRPKRGNQNEKQQNGIISSMKRQNQHHVKRQVQGATHPAPPLIEKIG